MIPELFDRVQRAGNLPKSSLTPSDLKLLLRMAYERYNGEHAFWGILDSWHHHENMTLFHVYNYGNLNVVYPWTAVVANWGMQWTVDIERTGTSVKNPGHPCPLSKTEPPFLVFESARNEAWDERLHPAMLFLDHSTALRQSITATFQEPPPVGQLQMQYCLRVTTPVRTEAQFGETTIHFEQPMAMEAGEIVVLRDQSRHYFGVVD